MTNKFKLTYGSGVTEEVITDADDVADQINRTFGLTVDEAKEAGVSVELMAVGEGDQPPADDSLFTPAEVTPVDLLTPVKTETPGNPDAKSGSVDSSSATVTAPSGVLLGTATDEAPVLVPTVQPVLVPTVPPVEVMVPVNTPEQIAPDTPIP